jgi:hypothetical protein
VPDIGFAGRGRVGIVELLDVPAFRRQLGDAISPIAQGMNEVVDRRDVAGKPATYTYNGYRFRGG